MKSEILHHCWLFGIQEGGGGTHKKTKISRANSENRWDELAMEAEQQCAELDHLGPPLRSELKPCCLRVRSAWFQTTVL